MYEDTPQELVHDLFSDAVFGSHALGRPVIGTAEVISTVSTRRDRRLPPLDVHGRQHRRRRRRGTSRTTSSCRCSERFEARSAAAARTTPHVRPTDRAARRRPACASSARTPSSTTSASARPASRAPTAAASPRRCSTAILGGSASSRLFQEIREKRGMAYAVYSFASQYTDTGLIGIYVGTREENLGPCVEICTEQIGELAAGKAAQGRAAPREGEPQGAHHALDGVDVQPDEPARQVAHRRDSELLTFERIIAEIDAVDEDAIAELAAVLLAPEQASRRPASARTRTASARRLRTRTRSSSHARRPDMRVALLRCGGEGRVALSFRCSSARATRCAASRSATSSTCAASTRRSTSRRPTRRRRTCAPHSSRGCRASSARRAGTRSCSARSPSEKRAAPVRRAELLDRRRADDALRGAGGGVLPARGDHRAAQRGEEGRAVGNRAR